MTPENFSEWFAAHQHLKIAFHLQGQMSGSGRVSYVAYATGLSVLFPVDLRYGWDLTVPAHRKMLGQVQNHFKPVVKFSSRDCRHWTAMPNAHPNKEQLAKDRRLEVPMLEWLFQDSQKRAKLGRGYAVESGLRSQICFQSPLSKNTSIPGNKSNKLDGCAHGLESKNGDPLQKAYRIDSNFKMIKTAKRCPGHGTRQHGHIEGDETARASLHKKDVQGHRPRHNHLCKESHLALLCFPTQ